MGTWGVSIFSDDLAADLRGDFRELIGDGLSSTQAVDRLTAEYATALQDNEEACVFWIALAVTQWKLGRLEDRTKQAAIQVIDSGQDLARWNDPADRQKRNVVLTKARQEILSPQPVAKRVPRTIREANDWEIGEVIAFRLVSDAWTLMRVIGHHTDKGGRFAICELLDWVGLQIPSRETIEEMTVRTSEKQYEISQFIFQQPKKKRDQSRVSRLGISSNPSQRKGWDQDGRFVGYAALVWPNIDRQLDKLFQLK